MGKNTKKGVKRRQKATAKNNKESGAEVAATTTKSTTHIHFLTWLKYLLPVILSFVFAKRYSDYNKNKEESRISASLPPKSGESHDGDDEQRCGYDPMDYSIFQPGDLDRMFVDLVASARFQQLSKPQILSMPKNDTMSEMMEGKGHENGDTMEDGPWVVLLENVLTAEECDTLVDQSHTMGINSSQFVTDVSNRSKVHSWGAAAGADDRELSMFQSINDKIESLTGIPASNAEPFLVVRYEVGQHYELHNDYVRYTKLGTRLVTVLFYLNDVEMGGGTRFPKLDLTVLPKKGSALIWPSVLNEDPNRIDRRTDHEALPVEKGIKYAVNTRLLQRNAPKDPSCPGGDIYTY